MYPIHGDAQPSGLVNVPHPDLAESLLFVQHSSACGPSIWWYVKQIPDISPYCGATGTAVFSIRQACNQDLDKPKKAYSSGR
jgi:hypothetical protein